ncbi:MAG: hypothetical protein Q7U75_11870 [Desulfobacterales bacterium]|nr:hypothetical protein [Desulfobacterales bacterium]
MDQLDHSGTAFYQLATCCHPHEALIPEEKVFQLRIAFHMLLKQLEVFLN